MEYDETAAIAFIRERLTPESSALYPDSELLNVIDMIWDWYEDNGLLDINADIDGDDDEADIEALTAYVTKTLAKDKRSPILAADIPAIVAAEIDYEDSLEEI